MLALLGGPVCVQMVDLAWGVAADQLAGDPSLPAMTMEEIVKCQRTSVGPNFVVRIPLSARPSTFCWSW